VNEQSERVKVTIEILVEEDTIAGTLERADGSGIHFAGWIGLITAIEAVRRSQ
jgi:hypothetical protein